MGEGNHQVDENMTNYEDYACSTDGVNMNTHNQACIAKLEFGEPSSSYNGNYIEMMYHSFNLSRLEIKQDNVVTQEDGFWNVKNAAVAAGLVGFSLGGVAFFLWARSPKKKLADLSQTAIRKVQSKRK